MYTKTIIMLAVAFIPLSLVAARAILPILKPPRHQPLLFVFAGILFFLVGAIVLYSLSMKIQTGVLDLRSHRYGDSYTVSSVQPIKFWFIVIALYAMGVISSAFGLAGISLCFRKEPRLLDQENEN